MLLVDGHRISSPRRPWHPRSSGPRVRLVRDLATLSHDWDACVDVVFEGWPDRTLGEGATIGGVCARFSYARSTAACIGELVRGAPAGTVVIVATTDHALSSRIAQDGAACVSCETLRLALDRVCGYRDRGLPFRSPLLAGPEALLGMERRARAGPHRAA
jgi:hypothetical protein